MIKPYTVKEINIKNQVMQLHLRILDANIMVFNNRLRKLWIFSYITIFCKIP